MIPALESLATHDRRAVLDAVVAVEEALDPVTETGFPALADPGLRPLVQGSLAGAGRTLVRSGDRGWISGYDDAIADRLAEEGTGVLSPIDAAVLALVVIHAIALPSARTGTETRAWVDDALPAPDLRSLSMNRDRRLTEKAIKASLRRLRDAGILRPGSRAKLTPGPQFQRLTESRSQLVWENLIIAAAPQSGLARVISRRRGSS